MYFNDLTLLNFYGIILTRRSWVVLLKLLELFSCKNTLDFYDSYLFWDYRMSLF